MKILVINCGSSSLKYQLIDMERETVTAKGLCERIGIEGSKLTHKVPDREDVVIETPMPDHSVVSNPPYSQRWEPEEKENDPRYARYSLP